MSVWTKWKTVFTRIQGLETRLFKLEQLTWGHVYSKPTERNGASVEACKCDCYKHKHQVCDICQGVSNTNEQSDEVVELAKIMHKGIRGHAFTWEEDYNTEQNRWIECAKIMLNAGYTKHSKTERCECLDSLFFSKAKMVSDLDGTKGGDEWVIKKKDWNAITSHFTAPNVKDDRDKLIIAMKEEILILRANIEDLKAEKQKCLSVDELKGIIETNTPTYDRYYAGIHPKTVEHLAKQLHQRIYEHKDV